MQRQHVDRIGQQPFRRRSRFDVEAFFAGVAIDLRLLEQTGKPYPQRLKISWGRVVGWREQACHHLGRDCCGGIVSLLRENLRQQPVAGIFEQHAVAIAIKQPHRAFAAPPGEKMLAA